MKGLSDTSSIATRRFLIGCVRAYLAAEPPPEPPASGDAEIDWSSLLQLGAIHRVTPLLYQHLRRTSPHVVSKSILEETEAYARSTARRSLLLTGELLRLVKALEARGIAAIPIKGPALASFLYGDAALRQYDDLDILLRPDDVAAAKALLLSLGYQSKPQLTLRQEQANPRDGLHEQLWVGEGASRIVVELHRDLVPGDSPFEADLNGVWDRHSRVSLAGTMMRTLSPEDLLLFLCAHGGKHSWVRLQWVCDVAQLVRRQTTLDWDLVLKHAQTSNAQQMLFLGLALADDLLGAPIPPALRNQIQQDALTKKFSALVKWRLLHESTSPLMRRYWKEVSFHLQAGARVRDRIGFWPRLWLKTFTTPTSAEWAMLPLPDVLFPLYYVVRPARLAGKYMLKVPDVVCARFIGMLRSVIPR